MSECPNEQVEIAVLKEKVKRLELIVYGLITMVFMELVGLFIFWVKDVMKK